MRSRLQNLITLLSTALLLVILVLWAGSYWGGGYLQRRHTAWAPGQLSSRGASLTVRQGRFGLMAGYHTMPMDLFLPEKWATLSLESQQRLRAFQAENPDFDGWDVGSQAASRQSLGETLYNSALGLEWDRVATPGPGRCFLICVPAWLLAAVLALPLAWRQRRRSTSWQQLVRRGFVVGRGRLVRSAP